MTLTTRDFEYDLPPERIAQAPAEPRDSSRLMVLRRETGIIRHHNFHELPSVLREGDLLVVNDTRVLPAKFHARRTTGGKVEGLFLREEDTGQWQVLLRNAGRCSPGEQLELPGSDVRLELLRRGKKGQWLVQPSPPEAAEDILGQIGSTPLPPYIHRPGVMTDAQDRRRYQTAFADKPGAVAAPTAGLHFTPAVLDALAAKGIQRTTVTLHVGLGTFAPVKTDDLSEHPMHSEWFEFPDAAAHAIRRARQAGGRVVAVGTTSVRVLESVARRQVSLEPDAGWTDLFLYPPAEFKVVDAMITNFHLPASTLLMLVAAFCTPGQTAGREMILNAYREAIEQEYRFYSYGDAMLIE